MAIAALHSPREHRFEVAGFRGNESDLADQLVDLLPRLGDMLLREAGEIVHHGPITFRRAWQQRGNLVGFRLPSLDGIEQSAAMPFTLRPFHHFLSVAPLTKRMYVSIDVGICSP